MSREGVATDNNGAMNVSSAASGAGDNKKSLADWLGFGSQVLGSGADFINSVFGNKNTKQTSEPVNNQKAKSDNTLLIVGGVMALIVLILLIVFFTKNKSE